MAIALDESAADKVFRRAYSVVIRAHRSDAAISADRPGSSVVTQGFNRKRSAGASVVLDVEEDIAMLTAQDCLALSELSSDEIDVIARHEHVPTIVAAELGHHLVGRSDGAPLIKRFLMDDIEVAERLGQGSRVRHLRRLLQDFADRHPDSGS